MYRKKAAGREGRKATRYEPKNSDDLGGSDAWTGSVFGSAKTKAARPRFDPKLRRGELYYGQKRPLSTDVCPDEPTSNFLDRVPQTKKPRPSAPPAPKAKKAKKAKVVAPPSSSSSSSSDSDSDSDSDSSSSSSSSGSSSSSSDSSSSSSSSSGS